MHQCHGATAGSSALCCEESCDAIFGKDFLAVIFADSLDLTFLVRVIVAGVNGKRVCGKEAIELDCRESAPLFASLMQCDLRAEFAPRIGLCLGCRSVQA